MNPTTDRQAMIGPGIMLLSAVVFGYFGFATSWNQYSALNGEFLLFVALLEWTLKGAAIGFAISAATALVLSLAGNLMYSVISLLSAGGFVVVAVLDIRDTQHAALHPALMLIFAAWNGYGGWAGLREAWRHRSADRLGDLK